MTRRTIARSATVLAMAFVALATHRADGQRFDPHEPAVLVVGDPRGANPTARVDARRSGVTRTRLPTRRLHVAWRSAVEGPVESPALVGPDGSLTVISRRSKVSAIAATGGPPTPAWSDEIRWSGAGSFTSDGTLVFATIRAIVGVSVASSNERFRTPLPGGAVLATSPLPLQDGGVVVAISDGLIAIDAAGNVRARAALDEPPQHLVLRGATVLAVGSSGAVYAWDLGVHARRVGAFGGKAQGVALTPKDTLLAIVGDGRLVEVEPTSGRARTVTASWPSRFIGAPSVSRTPDGGWFATALELTTTGTFVVAVDEAGRERTRIQIGTSKAPPLADAGAEVGFDAPVVGLLVDGAAAIAFSTPEGTVGVVEPGLGVSTVGERLCEPRAGASAVVGLTPLAEGSFVVTCSSGTIARIDGVVPSPKAPAPTPASGRVRAGGAPRGARDHAP